VAAKRKPEHPLKYMAVGEPALKLSIQKYRVIDGKKIVGQYSNLALVLEALAGRPFARVLDVSVSPPRDINLWGAIH
jgi:hypothetical protein